MKFLQSLIKTVYASRRNLGVCMGILFGIPFFLFAGNYQVSGFIAALIAGILFGLIMSHILWHTHKNFIKNIQNGRLHITRQYGILFRQNQVPENTSEYNDYAEYLDGLERLYQSTSWAYVFGPILFAGMFILTIAYTHQYDLSIFFGIALGFYVMAFIRVRHNEAKIRGLQDRLHQDSHE